MRKFDLHEDMSFEVCGEQFEMQTVRPEVLALWEDEGTPETAVAALEVVDSRILAFLGDNGQHERWRALRARPENSPSMGQLRGILEWMIEVQTARPTEQPSPSGRGRGRTATTSPDE